MDDKCTMDVGKYREMMGPVYLLVHGNALEYNGARGQEGAYCVYYFPPTGIYCVVGN